MKIVFAASSGGHFEQLMMLKPLMEKYDSFVLTEKTDYSVGKQEVDVFYLKQINRKEPLFLFKLTTALSHTRELFNNPAYVFIIVTPFVES